MSINPERIIRNMQVVGSDGESVGTVKSKRADDFLVDRPRQRDVYAPYSAVQEVSGHVVVLNCPAGKVDDMGWPEPSLLHPSGPADSEGEPDALVTGRGDPGDRGTWSAAADNYDLDPYETLTGGQTRPGLDAPDNERALRHAEVDEPEP